MLKLAPVKIKQTIENADVWNFINFSDVLAIDMAQ